jgi:cbb3-type cytochrome oxidase maturation protein
MFVLVVLIIISLLLAIGFLVAYLWAVKNNQYEDDYTPSVRILFEDKQDTDKDKDKSNN